MIVVGIIQYSHWLIDTGDKYKREMDRVCVSLASVGLVRCTLCNELVQLHHHAVAADVLVSQPGRQQGEHQPHRGPLHHQQSDRHW